MAFATTAEVSARLGRALSEAEDEQATALLNSATALMAQAAGKSLEWANSLEEVPATLEVICTEIVVRVMSNPEGLSSMRETLGSYSYAQDFADPAPNGAPSLMPTQAERAAIREAVGAPSTITVRMRSPLYTFDDDGLSISDDEPVDDGG